MSANDADELPNQAMQRTTGRRTISIHFMKALPLQCMLTSRARWLILFSFGDSRRLFQNPYD